MFRRIAVIVPLALTAAVTEPAAAVVAGPASTVRSRTVDEGTAFKVAGRGNCPTFSRCTYSLTALPGSATANADFVATPVRKRIRRGKKLVLRMSAVAVDDAVCEPDETFKGRLEGRGKGNGEVFVAEGTITIRDNDCSNAPATPAPTTPPPPAAQQDTGEPAVATSNNGDQSARQTCTTPWWVGVKGQYGAWGYYNRGCTATAKCPASAKTCNAISAAQFDSETKTGQRTTLNSRMRVVSAAGVEFWHRDSTCDAPDRCQATDMVVIRGGETATVQCNGVHANTPQNRSRIGCEIFVNRLS